MLLLNASFKKLFSLKHPDFHSKSILRASSGLLLLLSYESPNRLQIDKSHCHHRADFKDFKFAFPWLLC